MVYIPPPSPHRHDPPCKCREDRIDELYESINERLDKIIALFDRALTTLREQEYQALIKTREYRLTQKSYEDLTILSVLEWLDNNQITRDYLMSKSIKFLHNEHWLWARESGYTTVGIIAFNKIITYRFKFYPRNNASSYDFYFDDLKFTDAICL